MPWLKAATSGQIEDRKMAAKKSKGRNSGSSATKARAQSRSRKHKHLAEDSGLAQPDVLRSEPTTRRIPDALDRQFDFWMTTFRMSAWPTVLHQQITLTRTILEFWSPTKPDLK